MQLDTYASVWPTRSNQENVVLRNELASIQGSLNFNMSETAKLKADNEKLIVALDHVTKILEGLDNKVNQIKVEATNVNDLPQVGRNLVKGRYEIRNTCYVDSKGKKYCVPTSVFIPE